jgi:hypothetical protein
MSLVSSILPDSRLYQRKAIAEIAANAPCQSSLFFLTTFLFLYQYTTRANHLAEHDDSGHHTITTAITTTISQAIIIGDLTMIRQSLFPNFGTHLLKLCTLILIPMNTS